MRELWEDLDHCWREFDSMRRSVNEHDALDVEQFTSAWQVGSLIASCPQSKLTKLVRTYLRSSSSNAVSYVNYSRIGSYRLPDNIIRESLKQCISNSPSGDSALFSASSPSRPSSHSSNSSPYLSPHHLHVIATRKCLSLLPCVLRIIKYHLQDGHSTQRLGFFQWDAGLIRDGCFFAGFLAAGIEGDMIDSNDDRNDDPTGGQGRLSVEEGVGLCLTALKEMKWAFSKSEEREETVRMVWENRKIGRHGRHTLGRLNLGRLGPDPYPDHQAGSAYGKPISASHMAANSFLPLSLHGLDDRPQLPPIHLLYSPRRVESAPATAYSTDGHGANGWPSYTPPGTATSVATSAGTGVSSVSSSRGSPVFANLPTPVAFKGEVSDPFYHVAGDLEQFSFNAPVTASGVNDVSAIGSIASYHHRSHSPSSMHGNATSAYLDSGVFRTPSSSVLPSSGDLSVCSQFGENCNGYYH